MLIGLSHTKNKQYYNKQREILESMADRTNTYVNLYHRDYTSVDLWRNELRIINDKYLIEGIVILDELVPVPIIYRYPNITDLGISDPIYGNLSKQWVDNNNDGKFDVEEMPEEYHQDTWVCRLVPYCCGYTGVGWLKWWFKQMGYINSARFTTRSYSETLDYWKKKLSRQTTNPLYSFIATSDSTKFENGKGFPLNIKKIREYNMFDKIYNWQDEPYYHIKTSPVNNPTMQRVWYHKELGTHWHGAHSSSGGLGDFRQDVAYVNMKEAVGPTLLLLYACSVGEWNTMTNSNIVSNLFNSKENSNIKCIISSGIIQWGAGFLIGMDGEGSWGKGDSPVTPYHADDFFSFMKKYKGKPIGLAHTDWINLAYKHYIAKGKKYPRDDRDSKEELINFLAMNITGDGSLIL